MFAKLHAKLGDFWWYSLMIFCAARAGDLINAFIGLWLVPKYVGASELGAVLPLTSLSTFIALPVTIFATTFMKEMTTLATNGEYGKMKSLMRGVFIGAGVFLVFAIIATRFVLPSYLERIRIVKGSLGILIIAAAFTSAVAPIYSNALQALKRFKTLSFLNIVNAPVRLVVMLVAMPFRALSGYFAGQAATSAFSIGTSVWSLRKELAVPAEPYWSRPVVRRFASLFMGIAAYYVAGSILSLVEQTVLRQRLPDIDSAAYYMTTRFSDIANYLLFALLTVLFPFTASLAAEGKSTRPLVVKSSIALLVTGCLLAVVFTFVGKPILAFMPDGEKYVPYTWAIPCLILLTTLAGIQSFHTNTEVSAGRFGFLKWWVPVNLVFAAGLLLITGYGYFVDYLPRSWCDFLAKYNFTSLKAIMIWGAGTTLIKTGISLWELMRQK